MVKVDDTIYSYTLYYSVINYTDSLVQYKIKAYDIYGNAFISETLSIYFYLPNDITISKAMYHNIVLFITIVLLSSRKRIRNN